MLDQYHQGEITSAAIFAINQAKDVLTEYWASPFILYRPKLYRDGDQWCALYGENLQEGIAGFGKSPDAAVRAFNAAWFEVSQ
jgi:hypothetical protein